MHQFMTEAFVLSTKIPWISYLLSILINHTGKQTYSNIGKLWIPLNLQNFYLSDFWFHLKNWTHFTNIFPISTTGLCQILGLVVPFLHQAFSRFPNHILNVLHHGLTLILHPWKSRTLLPWHKCGDQIVSLSGIRGIFIFQLWK